MTQLTNKVTAIGPKRSRRYLHNSRRGRRDHGRRTSDPSSQQKRNGQIGGRYFRHFVADFLRHSIRSAHTSPRGQEDGSSLRPTDVHVFVLRRHRGQRRSPSTITFRGQEPRLVPVPQDQSSLPTDDGGRGTSCVCTMRNLTVGMEQPQLDGPPGAIRIKPFSSARVRKCMIFSYGSVDQSL